MTSTSSAADERPADQSKTLCTEFAQQPSGNSQATTIDVTDTSSGNVKENISPHGDGSEGTKRVADTGAKAEQEREVDDFGLPIRVKVDPVPSPSDTSDGHEIPHGVQGAAGADSGSGTQLKVQEESHSSYGVSGSQDRPHEEQASSTKDERGTNVPVQENKYGAGTQNLSATSPPRENKPLLSLSPVTSIDRRGSDVTIGGMSDTTVGGGPQERGGEAEELFNIDEHDPIAQNESTQGKEGGIETSRFSHQRLAGPEDSHQEDEGSDGGWRDMPALGEMDYYDDYGRLVAKGSKEDERDNEAVYRGLGGAGKGYTRVQVDEDTLSATSLDEDTSYLFKEANNNSVGVDDELRDATSQLQATKDLLTESQRIAYVGVTKLTMYRMMWELQKMPTTRGSRKAIQKAQDSVKKWSQMMMARLYAHMDINPAEQIMIEQLAEHGVQAADLVPPLMQNARVKNPLAKSGTPRQSTSSSASPRSSANRDSESTEFNRSETEEPPPYEAHESEYVPEVHTESQTELPASKDIDIDLRWTILCDLFLVLIADAAYDARSRTLLERVGETMDVSPKQICRFEKRVIDALEMQEASSNETWDESEHMEKRRKMALKKKYMIMGLATVGGGVVIGLSAGLLAPVIGAGLAAGFTTVGITGTGTFLGGAGGTALIASGATLTGSTIGLRASHRRTGAVRTFEYRPLHNNKRFNLIVTVAGWIAGGLDDVRLPYSTVDPIMGDLYSVLWEPEMLRSMGETINLLATEALTQGLQQVLGNTVLVALMSSLQLPLVLTKLSYLIDNPWNSSLTRANAAGLILADSLMDHNLGKRPITLLGFSLGSRVIFSCLKELAEKGAFGLVENVFMFGSPIVANKDDYMKARSAVSGTFVNGYATNDWILGYLFRATSGGIMRVAGLAPVEGIPRLENVDCTELVNGHMDYRTAMPRLLREVGWEVLSDEFEEIVENPDPDNHAERQRELIREIDAARREAELKPKKKRFSLFRRKNKVPEKKPWEMYDANDYNDRLSTASTRGSADSSSNGAGTVLFDTDAIKAELASENIEVKQLESTLPPMKLDLDNTQTKGPPVTGSKEDQMSTYDTPVEPPQRSYSSSILPPKPQMSTYDMPVEPPQRSYSSSLLPPKPEPLIEPDPEPVRPPLVSSLSTPATVGGASVASSALGAAAMEPNAWADEDDGEVQMSFE